MFSTDQPKVAAIAASGKDGFARVALLVVLSPQQHFATMGNQISDVLANGASSRFAYGAKQKGVTQILDDDPLIVSRLCLWQTNPAKYAHEAFITYLSYHGLGLVKAGFLVQLTLGQIGCLDTHNAKRLGLSANLIRPRVKYQLYHIESYQDACAKAGGAESLWNDWCEGMAARHPGDFSSAEEVSSYHWRALG